MYRIDNYLIRNFFCATYAAKFFLFALYKKKIQYPHLYNRFIHILIYCQDEIVLHNYLSNIQY